MQINIKRIVMMGRKIILIAVFVIIAAGIIFLLSRRYDDKTTPEVSEKRLKPSDDTPEIEQKMMAFTIDGHSPKGAKQWHLTGKSAEIKGEEIHLNDLETVAYGEDVTINITSNRGIYRKAQGEIELLGDVNIVSDDGTILETDRAVWSQLTKEVATDEVVHIIRQGMTAVGRGGGANSDERKAMLKEDITVTMDPDTIVNCNGPLEVNYNDNTAIFYNNVRVKDKEGVLFADKLTINFDPETEGIIQGVAEGNVKIKKGKSYTMSEKAIYTESTKSAQLLGRPRIIIDPEELAELEKKEGEDSFF